MKKLLLIAATTTALLSSFSAVACEGCEPEAVVPVATVTTLTQNINQFYVKVEGGAAFLNKTKDKFWDVKMKSKAAGAFGVGVGYYLMDNVRTDLTFNMLVNPQFKSTSEQSYNYLADKLKLPRLAKDQKLSCVLKHKGKIMTVLLNGYVDLFPLGDVAKVFVGAGAGWAQVKEKISGSINGIKVGEGSTRTANNFTYQATIGASVDLTDTVKGELSYSFRDYGKTKGVGKKKEEEIGGKTSYKAHAIMFGLRFNM